MSVRRDADLRIFIPTYSTATENARLSPSGEMARRSISFLISIETSRIISRRIICSRRSIYSMRAKISATRNVTRVGCVRARDASGALNYSRRGLISARARNASRKRNVITALCSRAIWRAKAAFITTQRNLYIPRVTSNRAVRIYSRRSGSNEVEQDDDRIGRAARATVMISRYASDMRKRARVCCKNRPRRSKHRSSFSITPSAPYLASRLHIPGSTGRIP